MRPPGDPTKKESFFAIEPGSSGWKPEILTTILRAQ